MADRTQCPNRGAVPPEPIGIGMVGGGMIGQLAHIANFQQTVGCRVVALAELRPDLGRAVAERFCIPHVYADHRALLRDPAVVAVVVATRQPATGPVVLDALRAGRHVLSEKPMAHTVDQAERLCAEAAAAERVYGVGFMKRHDAGVLRARETLDRFRQTGGLGRPRMVQGWCFAGDIGVARDGFSMTDEVRPDGLSLWPIGPDWMPPPHHDSYAWFLNVHIHLLNLVRFLMDATPTVRRATVIPGPARSVDLDFPDCPGVLAFEEIDSDGWHEGVRVAFECGAVQVDLPPPLTPGRSAVVTVTQGAERTIVDVPSDWAFRRQAAAFVRTVRGESAFAATGADSLADMRLVEALWRAGLRPATTSGTEPASPRVRSIPRPDPRR